MTTIEITRASDVLPEEEVVALQPIIDDINRLKRERNAIVAAHNYMTPDIYHGVADLRGDSLQLARLGAQTDAEVVEFYAKVLGIAMRDTVITAFDEFGVIVGTSVTVSPGTGWQLISLSGAIARIEVENRDRQTMNGIDDFGFTPLPEPSAALTLASGIGMLLALAKLRGISLFH